MEPTRITEPPFRISGSAFCTVNSVARALSSKVRSKFSSVILPSSSGSTRPEFATRMSKPPAWSRTVANSLSRSALLVTSPATVIRPSPINAFALSSSLWRRPITNTWAPSSTNLCAVARPIPLVPPVITATLPLSRAIKKSSNFMRVVDVFGRRPFLREARSVSDAGGEGVAEHGQPALGLFGGGFVLDDIPVISEHTVFNPYDVCHYPVGGLADVPESTVQHHVIAIGGDQRVLVVHVGR